MNHKPNCVMLMPESMQEHCFDAADLERISTLTLFRAAPATAFSEDEQRAAIAGAELAITGWGSHALSPAMLDAAPNLRMVFHGAGSVKWLIGDDFLRRGIRIASAAGALAVGVAEFAFGLMLMSMKGVWPYTAATREGRWGHGEALAWVREPYGATVGIVGASQVGREMIRLCRTLELGALLVYDPYLTAEEARALGGEKVELDELMSRSDAVSLHTPAIEACRGLINARNLALMKDRAIFINTSRGMCVDEAALIAELQSGRILACLDVTDPEPPVEGSPLYTLPNCILTPHIAGAIKQNALRQGKRVADQIEAYLQGKTVPGEIATADLERLA